NLPYPEGTACADVLIAGEKGGKLARNVFLGLGVAFLYKGLMSIAGLWKDVPQYVFGRKSSLPNGTITAEITPELLGVGYIIGPRISGIMVAGGVLSWIVLIPLITLIGDNLTSPMPPETTMLISEMSPSQIWSKYIRYIGAGAVTFGGIITLIKTLPTIIGAFKDSFKDLRSKDANKSDVVLRTDKDFPLIFVAIGSVALVVLMSVLPNIPTNFLSAVMIVVFGFFFVTVASRIVGLIGSSSSPVSGMTIATLMATSLIFIGIGWSGDFYQPIALVVGSIVCIAAANAGATSQDLKTGYLVGATPVKQQLGLLIGVLVSTVAIGFTLLLLHDTLGIGVVTEAHPNPLPAPQATLMATVIKGLLSQNLPWGLVIAGMGLSAVVELCGVSSLAFAVGAYLPLSTTSPIFIGGMVKMIADKVTGRKGEESEVGSGALFSSGLIAGGSLTGILVAVLLGTNVNTTEGPQSIIAVIHDTVHSVIPEGGNVVAIAMFAIMAYMVFNFAKTKIE
ncbi:MAG TPA: oligopeptide transporter, OPT family, partial [Cyclobacteriaceae bacterium]